MLPLAPNPSSPLPPEPVPALPHPPIAMAKPSATNGDHNRACLPFLASSRVLRACEPMLLFDLISTISVRHSPTTIAAMKSRRRQTARLPAAGAGTVRPLEDQASARGLSRHVLGY